MQNTGTRPRRLSARLALAFVATLVALVMAEVGLRVVLSVRGTPYDRTDARVWLSEIQSRARDTVPMPGTTPETQRVKEVWGVPHPYVGWETNFAHEMLSHDIEHLHRGEGQPFRILVLGGSVASIFDQLGSKRLKEILKQTPELADRRIEIRCYARGAYKQPQMLEYLTLMLSLEIDPDVVLLIDGFNEVTLGSANFEAGTHPIWPSQIQWLPLVLSIGARPGLAQTYVELRSRQALLIANCERGESSPWMKSALFGEWTLKRVRRREFHFRELSARYTAELEDLAAKEMLGPKAPRGAMAALVRVVRNWRECSRLMHVLCKSRGIAYLHVLQPTLHDPGAKPMTEEEIDKGKIRDSWLFGVEKGYPLMRKAGVTMVAEGLPFLDLSRVFEDVEETLYYDLCHFDTPGNVIMADEIAPRLLEEWRAVVESGEKR